MIQETQNLAGIGGALVGSFLYYNVITLLLSFPIAIFAASIYLEEFAPKNRITDFIEININNLSSSSINCIWFIGFRNFTWLHLIYQDQLHLVAGITLSIDDVT